MKKNFATTLAVCFLMIGLALNLQAQPPAKKAVKNQKANSADTPEKVAEDLCNCINNFLNQYHPSIRKMLEDMVEFGEAKATENFQNTLLSLQGKEQEKAIADAQRFSDDVNNGKMNKCIKAFEAKTATMTEAQQAKILQELENSPACKIVDDLIKLGNKDK
jgi:hypothetical protein